MTSIIVEAGVHDKTRRRRVGRGLRPRGPRLTPAEADRKAKPGRARRRRRRSSSKRVPWSAETRGREQSAGWSGHCGTDMLLVF